MSKQMSSDGSWWQSSSDYRVAEVGDQFEPQMFYTTKTGEQWVPLNEDGFWADPDCYSTGKVTVQSLMDKESAERAIWRAQLANRQQA